MNGITARTATLIVQATKILNETKAKPLRHASRATPGVSRTAQGILHGMAENSARSFSFVQSNVRNMSYSGLKDSFLAAIVPPSSCQTDAAAGGGAEYEHASNEESTNDTDDPMADHLLSGAEMMEGLLYGMAEASARSYSFVRKNIEDF